MKRKNRDKKDKIVTIRILKSIKINLVAYINNFKDYSEKNVLYN